MNIRKLFSEKGFKKGLLEFLDKRGFYIVLILCIAIVGATAVFVTTHNVATPDVDDSVLNIPPDESGMSSAVNNNQDKPAPQSSENTPTGDKKSEVAVNPPAKQEKTNTPAPSKTESNQKFIMPVFGEVSYDYAQDKLVYSKTLEEWRTHSGIDLAADRGVVVKAAADGVVSDIKNDPRLGVTVIVDHQNGIKTVYANLASDDMVSPNQKVKQGDVIGCVGDTAVFESAEQPHLHFEVMKNDEPVNPLDYLPNQSLN